MIVTIQGGWLDGKILELPAGATVVRVLEEPRTLSYTFADEQAPAEVMSNQLQLPLEHISEDQYLARWPVREDPRYCPECACPPEITQRIPDGWECRCRFGHPWKVHRRSMKAFPPSSWPLTWRMIE